MESLDMDRRGLQLPQLHVLNHSDGEKEAVTAAELQQDIVCLVHYLRQQVSAWHHSRLSSIRSSRHVLNTSHDRLMSVQHRFNEIKLMHRIQQLKKLAIVWNKDLQRSFKTAQSDMSLHRVTSSASDISALLVRPEHFERGLTAARQAVGPLIPFSSQTKNPQDGAMQVLSPWDGSHYKLQLIQSLCLKLQQKMILFSIQHYAQRTKVMTHSAIVVKRLRSRRLLELCFASILLESLSSRYIHTVSEDKATKHQSKKDFCSGWNALQTNRLRAEIQRLLYRKAYYQHRQFLVAAGLQLLRWNVRYNNQHRTRKQWALRSERKLRKGRALVAWVQVFLQRSKLRLQVQKRYSSSAATITTVGQMTADPVSQLSSIDWEDIMHQLFVSLLNQWKNGFFQTLQSQEQRMFLFHPPPPAARMTNLNHMDGDSKPSSFHTKAQSISNDKDRSNASKTIIREELDEDVSLSDFQLFPEHVRNLLNEAIIARRVLPHSRFDSRSTSLDIVMGAETKSCDVDTVTSGAAVHDSMTVTRSASILIDDAVQIASHSVSDGDSEGLLFSFCGEAEIDSDWERYSPQRQEELRKQLQENFQLLKLHWLIRSSHRFIKKLRRQTWISKQRRRLLQLHKRVVRRDVFIRWKMLQTKAQHQLDICDDIYWMKMLKKIFLAWFRVSVECMKPRKGALQERHYELLQRKMLRCWVTSLGIRRTQSDIQKQIFCYIKLKNFRAWKNEVRSMQRIRRMVQKIHQRAVLTPWSQWRRKFATRRLLKSVFRLRDEAWNHRLYLQPTPFTRLLSHFDAWREYASQRREEKLLQIQCEKAFYFRGATLLARFFVRWCEFLQFQRSLHQQEKIRAGLMVRLCFSEWADYMHQQRLYRLQLYDHCNRKRMWRIFLAWKDFTHHRCHTQPKQYASRMKLSNSFRQWRSIRPLRLLYHDVQPKNLKLGMQRGFHRWHGVVQRRQRYRAGLELLDQLYWCIKYRWAFIYWPGRNNIILARKFAEYRSKTRRNRIAFVDCTASEKEEDDALDVRTAAENDPMLSFISETRPSLAERAEAYGFIDSAVLDRNGLEHYESLMRTILELWQQYTKEEIELRHRGLHVHAAVGKRTLVHYLRKWILATPSTAYREVTWMKKGSPRPHDEYKRRKNSLIKMKEEQEQRSKQSMIEKRGIMKLHRRADKENGSGNELVQRSFR